MFVASERHVKLPLRIHSKEPVVTCLIQIQKSRRPLDRGKPRVAFCPVPAAHFIVILLAVLLRMICQTGNQCLHIFLDDAVNIDQIPIVIIDDSFVRQQGEKDSTPPKKGSTYRV